MSLEQLELETHPAPLTGDQQDAVVARARELCQEIAGRDFRDGLQDWLAAGPGARQDGVSGSGRPSKPDKPSKTATGILGGKNV